MRAGNTPGQSPTTNLEEETMGEPNLALVPTLEERQSGVAKINAIAAALAKGGA